MTIGRIVHRPISMCIPALCVPAVVTRVHEISPVSGKAFVDMTVMEPGEKPYPVMSTGGWHWPDECVLCPPHLWPIDDESDVRECSRCHRREKLAWVVA